MKNCTLCPRNCGVDRTKSPGACGAYDTVYVARAALHFWEEPVISGSRGSGAVFFSGCNLGCIFCQNAAISHVSESALNGGKRSGKDEKNNSTHKYTEKCIGDIRAGGMKSDLPGKPVSVDKLADIMLRLQDEEGANNINLVTAGHFAPQVAAGLEIAKDHGLTVPVVYNSSGYEKAETLRLFDGLVDVYLPDFKYITPEIARKLSKAKDYPEAAAAALDEMVRQAGTAEFYTEEQFAEAEPFRSKGETDSGQNIDKKGMTSLEPEQRSIKAGKGNAGAVYEPGGPLIRRGVIVRNLLLPGHVHESEAVLSFLHGRYGNRIYISIMNQYTPMPDMVALRKRADGGSGAFDEDLANLGRKVTKREYGRLVDFAINIGIENGFVQDGGTAGASFIPEWNGEGVD